MSSEVLSGIVNESDLSESDKAALIAFKTALNESLQGITDLRIQPNANPQDSSFLYMLDNYVLNETQTAQNPALREINTLYRSLPEKAQPRTPPKTEAERIAEMSESERALVDFKKAINEKLPAIIPELGGMTLHTDADAFDGAYIYLLENYVLNESRLAATPELSKLRDLYSALPPDVRIQTDTYAAFFANPSTTEGKKNQGLAVVSLAEHYLGTDDGTPDSEDSLIKIDERTSRALRDELEKLKSTENIDIEFDSRVFDQRAVDFLNAVVQKRTQAANVPPSALDGMLVQMWAIENGGLPIDGEIIKAPSREQSALGEAISLRNMMNFMVNAKLPSGTATTKPQTDVNWDSQWTHDDAGDFFFSTAVYGSLSSTKAVSTDTLFSRNGYSEESYNTLLTASERLGIDMSRGRTMSRMEVGKIAVEIMSIRAQEAWCMISPGTEFDEKKIHEMIHAGQFMPSTNDLRLVDLGMGVPDNEYFRQKLEEMGPQGSWLIEYEDRGAVLSHRIRAFAERFGEIPQSAVTEKAATYNTSENHIRHSYATPALYFGSPRSLFGSTEPTQYEIDRDAYLKRYQTFKEDLGTCNPTASAENDTTNNDPNRATNSDPCTVEGALRGDTFPDAAQEDKTNCDCIKTNAEDATGNEQGDCTVEGEVERRMNPDTAPTK